MSDHQRVRSFTFESIEEAHAQLRASIDPADADELETMLAVLRPAGAQFQGAIITRELADSLGIPLPEGSFLPGALLVVSYDSGGQLKYSHIQI